nr:uncharacterized mitochondrial protein AtMg00810-like [Tanacetum cinerariifolium]
DTLTQSMNYQPVVAGNQPNSSADIQENLNAGTVRKEANSVQQYVLLPIWSSGSKDPQNTDAAAFEVKEPEFAVHVSPSSCDKTKKHDDKTKREAKEKSLVELSTGVRDLSDEFEEFSDNSTNRVNAASTSVTAVGPNSTNSTNTFSAHDMPALEDITYSDDEEDVGAEADFSNLETNITVSPIPTTRVYKDHPVTQIIGDLSLAPKTRSMTRMGKEQGFEDLDHPDKVYKVVKALYGCIKLLELASTLIDTKKPLLKDLDGDDVDVHTYRSMIGLLMYLTSSRQDIMFVVCACARFQVTPKALHLHVVKKIFRYLKGMPHLGLWYPKDSPFNLVVYYSDYAGASLDRQFTTGGFQFLVARIKAIRLFLAYASFMGFMVYQMDVKSAFIYETIKEEVYVCQPLGFEDPDHPDKVYKVVKALYGCIKLLELASTLIDTKKPLLKDLDGEDVDVHTYRSMIGSLMYLTSSRQDIMFVVCACARFQVTPKALHLHVVKKIFRLIKSSMKLLEWTLHVINVSSAG